MAVAFFVPAQGLSPAHKKAVERVQSRKTALVEECAKAVARFIEDGLWGTAIGFAITNSPLSQADIARELKVMRSTVARWQDGSAIPLDKAVPGLTKKLLAAIRKSA